MGNSFEAVPNAIAQLGVQFADHGQQLGQSASSFGGNALEIADAFGLLGACDGAMKQYISMAQSTVQGLEQLAELWGETANALISQAEQYELTEEQNTHQLGSVLSGGGH
ncbi:MAG TPA: hypothetical protein VL551_13600 [Actinospica sp.]|jgi:hypothetical protein|nr:hypothetical protein [Actinospica sp.]